MYAYRTLFLLVYLAGLGETFGAPAETPAKAVDLLDLSAWSPTPATPQPETAAADRGAGKKAYVNTKLKYFTLEVPEGTAVAKVAYGNVDVWTPTEGKALKTLEVSEKSGLVQLVHLKVKKADGEEHLYRKKAKNAFTELTPETYTAERKKLLETERYMVDDYFPLNLRRLMPHLKFYADKSVLLDGVWKKTLTYRAGKPYTLWDGDQELWKYVNQQPQLDSVVEYEFADNKRLLVLSFGASRKYFVKATVSGNWAELSGEGEFATKVTEFKSKFFEAPLELDFANAPNLQKFVVTRKPDVGNFHELTLAPTRNHRLMKLKYNGKDVWTADGATKRAFRVKLVLLGYEVKLVHLTVTDSATKLEPDDHSFVYYKDTDGTFKNKPAKEFRTLLNLVKALADKSRAFSYNSAWAQQTLRLNLKNYDKALLTHKAESGKHGLVVETLTAKDAPLLDQVGYGETDLWPHATNRRATGAKVKEVKVHTKNGLVQLVHVNGTRDATVAEKVNTKVEVNFYFKMNEGEFVVVDKDQYNKFVSNFETEGETYYPDNFVTLDLNQELNENLYTVTTETFDGVTKKVVVPKNVKVSRLTNHTFTLWERRQPHQNKFLTKYEMHSLNHKKVLKLEFTQAGTKTEEHYEKADEFVEWAQLTTGRTVATALTTYKAAETWADFELDLAKAPSEAHFTVAVERLRGNRTHLTLTTLPGKRVTKVKVGATELWTRNNNRLVKLDLYLETYEAKFVFLSLLADGAHTAAATTLLKKLKGEGNAWFETEFDTKLNEFKTGGAETAFTYNPSWVVPPVKFDTKSFNKLDFEVTDTLEGLVKTTKYAPKPGNVVKHVLVDEYNVWPDKTQNVDDNTKKLEFLEVLSKEDMVQLAHVKVVPTTGEAGAAAEELYYKKEGDTYTKLEDANKFNELKASLATRDTFLDDKVKLDLSADVSTNLFTTETTLEDGVEKTVVEVKQGKLFEVKASPPLWKSTNGDYVTKLERYSLDSSQLLVLHVTGADSDVTKKYFEKPLALATGPEAPARADAEPRVQSSEVQQQESQVQEPARSDQAAERPSFSSLDDKTAFFKKLNQAKAAFRPRDVTLNLNAYNDTTTFVVQEAALGNAKVFKLLPRKGYKVTALLNGTTELWKNNPSGSRLVEASVYLHDEKVKFFHGVVWARDRTDESTDRVLYFALNDSGVFEEKTKEEFEAALTKVTAYKPPSLKAQPGGEVSVNPRYLYKLFLAENVNTALFDVENETTGEYTFRTLRPKADTFVNAVEAMHVVLWKALQKGDLWTSAWFALKGNTALADFTVRENSLDTHKYFKFDNGFWTVLNNAEYTKLRAAVPGRPKEPARPAPVVPEVRPEAPVETPPPAPQPPTPQVEAAPREVTGNAQGADNNVVTQPGPGKAAEEPASPEVQGTAGDNLSDRTDSAETSPKDTAEKTTGGDASHPEASLSTESSSSDPVTSTESSKQESQVPEAKVEEHAETEGAKAGQDAGPGKAEGEVKGPDAERKVTEQEQKSQVPEVEAEGSAGQETGEAEVPVSTTTTTEDSSSEAQVVEQEQQESQAQSQTDS